MDAPGATSTASDLVAAGDPMQPALNRLLEEPGRFGFFQAVRLLYGANGFDGRGTGARPGPLRFTTPASLSRPNTSTSERYPAMRLGSKLTTATTSRPGNSPAPYTPVSRALDCLMPSSPKSMRRA